MKNSQVDDEKIPVYDGKQPTNGKYPKEQWKTSEGAKILLLQLTDSRTKSLHTTLISIAL